MNELLRRLFLKPWLAGEILAATFFINLLYLASPIYVIQILSRYIPYGFTGTLVTLTTGMLAALVLMGLFMVIRNRLSAAVSIEPDRELADRAVAVLAHGRSRAFTSIPQHALGELVNLPQSIQAAFDATRINAVVDLPFCLLFLLALAMLSPSLALVTVVCIVTTVIASWMSMNNARRSGIQLQRESAGHRGLVNAAVIGAEAVRAFRGWDFLKRLWDKQLDGLEGLKKHSADQRSVSMSLMQSIAGVLRVAIYAWGAYLVVQGQLSVGALIGASILASKALSISTSFMQARHVLAKAEQDLARLKEFFSIPLEPQSGTALRSYSGSLELRDVGFAYPNDSNPLFESLSVKLQPGSITAIVGYNGAGKSTLCKIAVGLMEPSRGNVLVDGVELRQLAPDWWRQQVVYMPQEATFLPATIRENITLANPDIDSAKLGSVVRAAGLRRFLDTSKNGIEMVMAEGGRNLPLGIRRRIALARALSVGGRLVVLDEPTEGLDAEGCAAVYSVMNAMAKQGLTIIVVSQDRSILKGVSTTIDLSVKPVPNVLRSGQVPQGGEA